MLPTFMVMATYHTAKILLLNNTECQGYIFEKPSIMYINMLFPMTIRLSSIFLSTSLTVRHKY